MDLEQIREDFKQGKMISKCTWALVLKATEEMEDELERLTADGNEHASDCLGRVAAL